MQLERHGWELEAAVRSHQAEVKRQRELEARLEREQKQKEAAEARLERERAAVVKAAGQQQLGSVAAVRISGSPTDTDNGVYFPVADHDGMPRYEKDDGGSKHLYYHMPRSRWLINGVFTPDSDKSSAWSSSVPGTLPDGMQLWKCYVNGDWTGRGLTVELLDAAEAERVRQESLIRQFVSRCGSADAATARSQLDRHGWELEAAVRSHEEAQAMTHEALEANLKLLMRHGQNVADPSCLRYTFAQSGYKASYNQCGRPRDHKDQWTNPMGTVQRCLPQAFDQAEWRQAVRKAPAGSTPLQTAGAACAHLWTAGPVCRLINQVIMDDDNRQQLDRMMPFIRCFNDYLLSGSDLANDLMLFRTSRLTDEQAARIDVGSQYRVGMYVATSTTEAAVEQMRAWQAGEVGFEPKVRWVFTVPAGCLQVCDLRSVSGYPNENEVTMVPYTAIRIDDKRSDAQGTTISATVLRDAYAVSEALMTILA